MRAVMASCATVSWDRSGAANRLATRRPPGRRTRAASDNARHGSPANWKALTPVTASKEASANGSDSMSDSRRSASGSRSRAMPSRPGLMSRPTGIAPRPTARTRVRPDPQPTSSRRVPGPAPAASRTASNSGRLCDSASSAQARGSVPHRRRWTSAAALIMPRSGSRRAAFAQRRQAAVHAGDDVVVLVELDGMREQRPAVVPGDRDRARPGGVDQPAAQPLQPGALLLDVGYYPGDVADRAGRDAVRGREAVVDRVDLAKLDHDRPPGGEGGRVVEYDDDVAGLAGGEHELLERDVLDNVERADVQVPAPLLHRGIQVVDPVPDVVQGVHQRPSSAPPPNCLSCSMVIRMNG